MALQNLCKPITIGLISLSLFNIFLLGIIFRRETVVLPSQEDLPKCKEDLHVPDSQLKVPRNIFFLETYGTQILTHRQACAVESAAKYNNVSNIYLYMSLNESVVNNNPLMTSLRSKYPIKFMNLDLEEMFRYTPGEAILKNQLIEKSSYKGLHKSDLARLMLIWTNGGIYLDLDFVVLRSLDGFENFLVIEKGGTFSNGAFGFSKKHPFIKRCLDDFYSNYNPNEFSSNGPQLISRNVMKYCRIKQISYLSALPCDIKMFPGLSAYEITFDEKDKFFETKPEEVYILSERIKPSLMTHAWNYRTKTENRRKKLGENTFYEILLKRHCPVVYSDLINRNILYF